MSNTNVQNIDTEQTPIWVIDDGIWCRGFLTSDDPMAAEVQVRYTDRSGSVIEDCIPNNRDNVRIINPSSGTTVALPDGHLANTRGKDRMVHGSAEGAGDRGRRAWRSLRPVRPAHRFGSRKSNASWLETEP